MIDRGRGTPIVVVQALPGRWEFTRELVRELSRGARVVTYSLCGELGSGRRLGVPAAMQDYVAQLRDVMDAAGLESAALCGISFGGAVAARFAAEYPERVTRLVIVSTPGPGWKPTAVQAGHAARPWLSLPAFAVGALTRTAPEIVSALATWRARLWFVVRYAVLALRYPALPHLMAGRVRLLETLDLAADCARIAAPTLVVTGEPRLDRVVPVDSTRRYAELIRGARYVMVDRTGHQGVLTQPRRFAALVNEFIHANHS
ncbi:MAG TPA: alpha/beta hydrolase [Vicinamibacterales bacterium]|nr:alpha/beta hydrolase [Vicinamibacterales bacterium]